MQDTIKKIAEQVDCPEDKVYEIAGLVLEALHEVSVKTEQVPGGILTEPAWMLGSKVCYHLNGILYEYMVHHKDERTIIHETMLRFMPQAWEQYRPIVEKWDGEKSELRKHFDETSNE